MATTYLVCFDIRAPQSVSAVDQLSAAGATEIWPGMWLLTSDLQGMELKQSVHQVFSQQGYLLTPFSPGKTSAVGISGGAPARIKTAIADLLAKPIAEVLVVSEPDVTVEFIVDSFKTIPAGQGAVVSTD